MRTLYIKIISTGVIFTVTFLGGFLPFTLLRKLLDGKSSAEDKLCLLRCLAGGIFLGTCLVHLLPEAREAMTTAFGETEYPVTEVCVGIGFLVMYITENLMIACKPTPLKMESSVAYIKRKTSADVDIQSSDGNVKIKRYGSLDESDCSTDSVPIRRHRDKESTEDVFVSDTEPLLDSGVADVVLKVDKTSAITKEDSHSTSNFTSFRSYVLLVALSLHTVFDGLVIGIQESPSLIWTLLVAMSIHKTLVAFSLGLSFLDSHASKPRSALLYLLFFATVAPIGAGIGTALTETNFNSESRAYAAGFLQSFATGTFMFVTFCECLKDELLGTRHFLKLLLVTVGFASVAGLRFAINDE